jgi:hypothetical protein
MLDILTPLSKLTRVSRSIHDMSTFVAKPGIWGNLTSDGSIDLVTTGAQPLAPKLVINSASDNIYESQDVEVGRIATLESPGARCKVDLEGYDGTVAQANDLVVSATAGKEGKLVVLPVHGATTHVIVARAEQVDMTNHWIIFETVSPRKVTVPA